MYDESVKDKSANDILMGFQEIESVINESVWVSDSVGAKKQFYTQSIKKITGYTANEILDLPENHCSIIFSDDVADVKKELNNFEKSGVSQKLQLTYRIIRKDNILRWVKEEIEKKDGIKRIGVITDITSLNEKDSIINDYKQKLKEVNAAKDSFITILSHDLRAPFTSILGFAEILMNEPDLPLQDKTEYLSYIYEASQNQLQLINYLLDWSRLQTGRLIVEPQRLKAQAVVFNCVSSLTGNAIRKNLEIEVDVDDAIFINADERLITQAISNLLNNAIKFSRSNSKIEISANNFNDTQIEFIIRDSGVGISEEDQSKIFKVENMFSTEGTSGEKGSGLGLPLVKEIIEKHGGAIWFYSQQDSGSEFHFTVHKPLNSALLVNNNSSERDTFLPLIKGALPGFEIYKAENGFEAMNLILEKSPSIVIADHDLPLMNGLQLIESVTKGNAHCKIPFVILAKYDSPELRQSYYNYGVSLILTKPVDFTEFTKIVQNLVN